MSTPLAPVVPEIDFDLQVKEKLGDDDTGYGEGWWCVGTGPWPCPASGCLFVAHFMTVAHRILVWPAMDDRAILTAARDAVVAGRNPRIVEYKRRFGPCITYDKWRSIGSPVHAYAPKPDGWDEATRRRL